MQSTDQSFLSNIKVDSIKGNATRNLRSRTTSRIDKRCSNNTSFYKESDQDVKRFKQEMVELQKKNKKKFDQILQIPFVINDPKILERRVTLKTFSSCAQSGLFEQQQKKASTLANTIKQKGDSKALLGNITKIKTLNSKNDRESSAIKCNELWSKVYTNQVFRQSRLSQLNSALSMKKINMTQEEQLQQFSKFFQKHHKQTNGTIPELVSQIEGAFRIKGSPPKRKRRMNKSMFSLQSDIYQYDNNSEDSQQIQVKDELIKYIPKRQSRLYKQHSQQNYSDNSELSRFQRSVSQKLITLQNISTEEIEDCSRFSKKVEQFLNQDEIRQKNRMISFYKKLDFDDLKEILGRQHRICDNIHVKKRKQELQVDN